MPVYRHAHIKTHTVSEIKQP